MLVIPEVPLHSFLHLITQRVFQEVSSFQTYSHLYVAFGIIPIYRNVPSNMGAVLWFSYASSWIDRLFPAPGSV